MVAGAGVELDPVSGFALHVGDAMKSARKPKPPKPVKEERWQTHVYLSPADFRKLADVAERESRSVTGQIQHYIRQGLSISSANRAGEA